MEIDKIIKREVVSLVISIILILLIFIGVSYASFFSVAEGESNTISFGDIDLTFCSDVNCNENYTNYGQTIGLTEVDGVSTPLAIYPYESNADALATTPYIFNIANTGTLKLFVNAYLEEDTDFTPTGSYSGYTQTTTLYAAHINIGVGECTGGIPDTSAVTIYKYGDLVDNKILTDEQLEVNANQTYCLWTWLDETTPNAVQTTYFVANLTVSGEYKPDFSSLKNMLLQNNTTYADNVASTYVSSSTGIDFGAISSATNGQGLYYTTNTALTEGGKRVYYFRGNIENNYVIFGGYCWRVIRTNEDNSVRLRFGGEIQTTDGTQTCLQTGGVMSIGSSAFNSGNSDNTLLGYMTGTLAATSYNDTHSNSTDSAVKGVIDTWYSSHLLSYTSKLANVIYCNDRSLGADGTVGGVTFLQSEAYGTNNAIYAVTRRLATGGDTGTTYSSNVANPTYVCAQSNDQFTLSVENGGTNGYGNNKLTYPIALMTADELVFAGSHHSVSNTTITYLSTSSDYWTMSPFRVGGSTPSDRMICYKSTNQQNVNNVASAKSVVPVISVKETVPVVGGDGTYSTPYVLE